MSLPVEEAQTLNNDDGYLYMIVIKSSLSSGDHYMTNTYKTEHELREGEKRAKSNGIYKIIKCKIF